MSVKKIIVLYRNEEKTFEIDLQENHTYESFLKKINEEFKRTNTYQLMAMNSSEQYAILNSDNFLQILNEDVPEVLKLFMSEMVKAPEMMNSNDEQNKDNKEEINAEEDDEDFVIENTQINEEIKNNDTEKDKKSEDNGENKNIIKEDKKDDEEKNNKVYLDAINFKSMILTNPKSDRNDNLENKINFFLDEKGKEEEKDPKSKYILSSNLIKREMFKNEKCSICNSTLQGVKYVCCLCDNYIICEDCELYHNHPCFKYKINFVSNIFDTSNFIEKAYGFKLPVESTGYTKLFRKEYDLKIAPMTDLSFSLRPNKRINIPIKILNYSKETINSSQFVIICKNQKNIFFSTNENEKFVIEGGGEYVLNITCITPEKTCKKENIFIEIYSHELNIKMSRRLIYEYFIEVNFDSDDDKLNIDLKNDDYIFCFNKEHKRLALNLMKSTNSEYPIKNVFRCLYDNNWDQKKAIKDLKKRK
jgi:hypothetical protein